MGEKVVILSKTHVHCVSPDISDVKHEVVSTQESVETNDLMNNTPPPFSISTANQPERSLKLDIPSLLC